MHTWSCLASWPGRPHCFRMLSLCLTGLVSLAGSIGKALSAAQAFRIVSVLLPRCSCVLAFCVAGLHRLASLGWQVLMSWRVFPHRFRIVSACFPFAWQAWPGQLVQAGDVGSVGVVFRIAVGLSRLAGLCRRVLVSYSGFLHGVHNVSAYFLLLFRLG